MKPIYEMYICNIDITNHCDQKCVYCSRFTRHVRGDQRYFMSLDRFAEALDSLVGWPGQIGISGGEPTLHPEFPEICRMIREHRDKFGVRFQLFTNGGSRFQSMKEICVGTFVHIPVNKHDDLQKEICLHQPTTIAIQEVVPDKSVRDELIDNCWVQSNWAPVINSKGAFFCEIAGAMDIIFDGHGGFDVERQWWNRTPEQFKKQVERYCQFCGMPVPINREKVGTKLERFTPRLYEKYLIHDLARTELGIDIEIFKGKLTKLEVDRNREGWDPGNYRQDMFPES